MNGKLIPLKNYLQNCAEFATILAKMQLNSSSLRQVQGLLPPPLNDHCTGLVVRNDQLILFTDSSAWASRLRYYSRELIIKLKQNDLNINKISVKVMMHDWQKDSIRTDVGARLLSTENADFIMRVAEHTSDPDLQAALRRLSSHRKNQK